ncbi:hypothetical protein Rhe02_42310 [Rhizocola hellebori]|uniref:Sulfotransferase family protein n=1 Tax=Rhizocola hellebori TaxID=1392758 RepID=A0A8J3Q8U0_9ACTN|nr:hypothetical protein [Rhizocola hellebori]GIH06164.1 hypothetical protein Rhe02_42310 [Rhizocola hellebori]
MMARRLVIEAKQRPYPLAIVGPHHFRVRDGGPVGPETVLSPGYSLYCLGDEKREALFVDTGPDVDLSSAAFFYQTQYDAARALVAVPYEALHTLAGQVNVDDRQLILLFSIGRCGSTLASRAFAATGVPVWSEPDAFTQLVMLRADGRCDPATLRRLVRSCAQVTFRGSGPHAVKFRSCAIELAELLAGNYPAARVIFLYRQADTWTQSSLRAFGAYDPVMVSSPSLGQAQPAQGAGQSAVQDRLGLLIPLLATYRRRLGRLLSPLESLACQWVRQMECAMSLYQAGVTVIPVRYEDLVAQPRQVLADLFARCGLDPDAAAWRAVDSVFQADSQAGTSLSRSALGPPGATLDDAQRVELARVIADLSTVVTPDTVLPVSVPR